MSRHTKNTWIVSSNIYFFWCYILLTLSDKLADKTNLDLFTDCTMSSVSGIWVDLNLSNDLPLSYLLLMDLSFFSFRYLWFLCFVDFVDIIFRNGRSNVFPQYIRFCSHVINPLFDNFVCSRDQWLLWRHDLGAWSSLLCFIQNQSKFTGDLN